MPGVAPQAGVEDLAAVAGVVAEPLQLPVADTLARAGATLGEPIDRSGAVRVQTPQAFRREGRDPSIHYARSFYGAAMLATNFGLFVEAAEGNRFAGAGGRVDRVDQRRAPQHPAARATPEGA